MVGMGVGHPVGAAKGRRSPGQTLVVGPALVQSRGMPASKGAAISMGVPSTVVPEQQLYLPCGAPLTTTLEQSRCTQALLPTEHDEQSCERMLAEHDVASNGST